MRIQEDYNTFQKRKASKRLWRGKAKLARKQLFYDFSYFVNVKIGDYIASCEGCNRKVADVKYYWENEGYFRRLKPNRTWYLHEIEFIDTNGHSHYFPGCVSQPETVKEINDFHLAYLEVIKHEDRNESDLLISKALENNQPIVDDFGEYLPEFDTRIKND